MVRKSSKRSKRKKRQKEKRSVAKEAREEAAAVEETILTSTIFLHLSPESWKVLKGLVLVEAPAVFIRLVHLLLLNGTFTQNLDFVEYFAGEQAVTNAVLNIGLCAVAYHRDHKAESSIQGTWKGIKSKYTTRATRRGGPCISDCMEMESNTMEWTTGATSRSSPHVSIEWEPERKR